MKLLPIVVSSVLLAACASVPPPELNDARAAVDNVSYGPAAELAPADVAAAQEALRRADVSFDAEGASSATRDLAYAARRRAQLAAVRAETIAARSDDAAARAQLNQPPPPPAP